MNMRTIRTLLVVILAFVAGFALARLPETARAAAMPLQPAAIDLTGMSADAMPTPSATFPNLRSKTLVATDGMTAAYQVGTAPRHYHADANEIQIVLEGTGTEWLGDQQVPFKPGTLIIIPKGTNHAGIVVGSGPIKILSMKTPPQDPSDIHLVP
jgi:mannose-6-phosphate isomerase-like protein (cupin superfamily)